MFSTSTVSYAVLQVLQRITQSTTTARVRSALVTALLALAAVLPGTQTATAQGGARLGNDSSANRDRKPPTPQQIEERRKMVAEFEQRVENSLFTRLQATEEQRTRMRALKKRLDVERNKLFKDEGDFRRAMRMELTASASNEGRLSELLETWPALQRRRIELEEREQKELAKFLQPRQRALFFAFQDEFRRARQETQWGRDGRGGRGGPPGMPGMRGDSTGGKRNGDFRGGGSGGGRGSRPPGKDTVIKK